jgi:hypothetical protein
MKGKTSFLLALLLLLLATSLLAQHDENSVSVFLNAENENRELSPRRDPDQFQGEIDWITYDDNEPGGSVTDLDGCFSRVSFTPEYNFELRTIQLMALNDFQSRARCDIYVYEEDGDHNLRDRLYLGRINQLPNWNGDDIQRNWMIHDLNNSVKFEQGQSFSIIYGPAPGGQRDMEPRNGDGWWNLYDRSENTGNSFVARRIEGDHRAWTEYRNLEGNLFIRAGGIYDIENNEPYWGRVPEDVISVDEGDEISFTVEGVDEDDDEELVIEYESGDIPDDAHFEYEMVTENRVEGSFIWQTGYDDEGTYEAVFTLTDGKDKDELVVVIEINDANAPPEWTNVPNAIQVNEEATIAFWVQGRDNDGDKLEVIYNSEDLPREATFRDYSHGRGFFNWRTTTEDAGEYTAVFTITDGEAEVSVEVPITVIDTNRPPEWAEFPQDRLVSGFVEEEIRFGLTARDPEDDDLEFDWSFIEAPDNAADGRIQADGNEVVFEMEPGTGEHGTYVVRFTVSDGTNEVPIDITIEVSSDHYKYIRSGRGHTIRFRNINYFGEVLEWEEDENNFDEIAVITEHEQVAGAYRFCGNNDYIDNKNKNDRQEEGFIFTAWGDLSNTQEVEGFAGNERYHFEFWDSDARETYNTKLTIVAGHETWRRDGYSLIDLNVGPMLSIIPQNRNFGQVEVDKESELTFTLTSVGTTPIEDLVLSIDNEAFTLDEDGPFNMAMDARRTVRVTFTPTNPGHYNATLTAGNDYIEKTVQLSGVGFLTGNFEYTITEMSHRIEVVRAVLGDENLSEDDEIGVFIGELCAGALIIRNNGDMTFDAWGDDPETGEREGFREGERFSFKFWDDDAQREYNTTATYLQGPVEWEDGETTIVALYSNDRHFNWIETEESHEISVGEVDLDEGDEIAVITPRGTVAGALTVGGERPYRIQAFGDDPDTENIIEGFLEGELIYFRVWMRERNEVFFARPEWEEEEPVRWENRGESVVNLKPDDRNRRPSWRQVRETKVSEGERLEFAVVATDPDRDPISIWFDKGDLPDNIQFTDRRDGSGIFTWTPDYDQAGEYSISFIAYDGWEAVTMNMEIAIENANQPPVLAEINDIEIDEEERFSLMLEAEDPDGNNLRFSYSGNLQGASIEDNLFRWTPNSNQSGEYQVIFSVTDYGQPPKSDQDTVTITVNNLNQPPEWDEVNDVEADEGERVSFGVRASDDDDRNIKNREGNLSLSVIDIPEGAEFADRGRGRGVFNWQTDLQSSGEYHPRFIAFDGNERDTLTVSVTIKNRNRPPEFEKIDDQQVTVGDTLRLEIYAEDSDEGDQAELELSAESLPYGATFTDQGEGHGLLNWAPRYDRRGMHGRVTFLATDPDGDRDVETPTFTAVVNDSEPPLITNVTPDSGEVIRYNQPKISAEINDEISEIRDVDFTFDNRRYQGGWDARHNEFSWGPDDELSEGVHRYSIRAVDSYRNTAVKNGWFIVDSDAGEIVVDELPEYTRRESINITGRAEEGLSIELYRGEEQLMQTEVNRRGEFSFDKVELEADSNNFTITGGDEAGNIADPASFTIYLDLEAPEIEFISDWFYTNERNPLIQTSIIDEGAGIDVDEGHRNRREQGIQVTLDGHRAAEFNYEGDTLSFIPDERNPLDPGTHIVGISAVDRLGNASEEPVLFRFFVDTERPVVEHQFFDDDVEVIANQRPRFTIPVSDPMPGSGINEEAIRFGIDGHWYNFEWDEREGAIYYESGRLNEGNHEIRVDLEDRAGNGISVRGHFTIDRRRVDEDPPYFENLYPPRGGIAGRGKRERDGGGANADTISFVVGDEDAGVNVESIWMMIIALHDPDDPRDNDTTYIGRDRMMMNGGRVSVPINNYSVNINRDDPNEMPGLEEGFNEVNIFANDEEDNGGEDQWQFFFDDSPPDPPEIDVPESEYYNTTEFTLTGTLGSDEPDYEDENDNEAFINIYVGDSLVVESAVYWESEFEVSGVELVEGWNEIYALVLDGGGNDSEHSDTLRIYLDLSEPTTESFEATNGAYLATGTPSFTAILTDVGSGLDTDNIALTIGDLELVINFDAEEDLLTAQVHEDDALGNGDYIARLIVLDLAGNADTTEYSFNIDIDPVNPPEILTFERYTSINQISLTGEGLVQTYIKGYLDDENVGDEVALGESTEFTFEHTAVSLDDTSYVDITARNEAGTESEHTDSEMLIVDSDGPVFSDETPSNGTTVDAGSLEEITVLINDEISGIEPDSMTFQFDGNPIDFEITETENGYIITANVSEFEFTDEQSIEVVATIYDKSDPPNEGALTWEFIANINDAPTIALPDTSFDEDENLTLDLSNYAEDEDNNFDELQFTATLIVGGDNATVEIDNDEGLLHISADDDWFGNLRLVVEVEDTLAATDSDTIDVVVLNANDPPVFESVPEDTTIETGTEFQMEITASDIDPDDGLTFDDDTDIFDVDENGQVSFTPDVEMLGQHIIQFYVFDTEEASDTVEFNLFIVEPNQEVEITMPIEDVEIDEDADPVELVDLDDIFNDPEGAELNYEIEYSQDGILLDINSETGVMTLTLDQDFNGEVEVIINADDLAGSAVADTFIVNVNPVNDAPLQIGLLPEVLIINEDAGRTIIADLDSIFTDVEEDELNFYLSGGEHLGVDIDENLVLSIDPDADWNGEESFTLSADDGVESARMMSSFGGGLGRDETSELEITVEVGAVNDAPRVSVDNPFAVEMDEDQEPLTMETAIAELFSDPDQGDAFTVSWEDDPDAPIELSLDDDEEYIIATIVTGNFNGTCDYEITATDLEGESTDLTLTFTINAVNDTPDVSESIDDIEINEDADPRHVEIADLDDIFTDIDGDDLDYSVEGAPAQLNIGIDEDNILFVEPDDNYNIPDGTLITVIADDEGAEQINASQDLQDDFNNITAVSNIGPVRKLRSSGDAASLNSLTVRSERGLRSTNLKSEPDRDAEIDNSFLLTINPSNDDPYWEVTNDQEIDEWQTLEFTVTADDPDLQFEGDDLTLTIFDDDGLSDMGAQFTDNGDGTGTFSWQPGYDDSGDYNPVFRVTDSNEAYDDMSLNISVNHINRAPVWVDVPDNVESAEEDVIEFIVEGSDPDGDAVSVSASSDDLPDGWEFTDNNDGTGTFNWITGFDDEGSYHVTFTIADNEFEVTEDVLVSIGDVNRPPVWGDVPANISINENAELSFTVQGSDPDDDAVTITADSEDLPEGWEYMDNDNGTCDFTWTPTFDDAGEYSVTFTISDEQYDIETEVVITVNNVNRTPVWDSIPEAEETDEDQQLEFTVESSDPDGDALSIDASSADLPEGWQFTDNEDGTGTFTWTPSYDDAGSYTLTLNLTDGDFEVDPDVSITVNNVNRAPGLVNPPDEFVINENVALEFTIEGDDPDGDAITIGAASDDLPEGWDFIDNGDDSGDFSWTPSYTQAGEYSITFTVSDDDLSQEYERTITVNNVNRAPVEGNIYDAYEGSEVEQLAFQVDFTDPDGDQVSINASSNDLPEGWEFTDNENGTGDFSWTPSYNDAGEYNISFTASDGGMNQIVDVLIIIYNVNREPIWEDIPEQVDVSEVHVLEFDISASDPDGNNLTITYSSEDIPDNAEFTDNENGTGSFYWRPTYNDAGEYSALFTLEDDEASIEHSVTIIVNNVNRAPVISNVNNRNEIIADESDPVGFELTASDPDGDGLSFSFDPGDLPESVEFIDNEDGTASFSWQTGYNDAGEYYPLFTASDNDLEGVKEVLIIVGNVNRAPEWVDVVNEITVSENANCEFSITATDPDGDAVIISAASEDLPYGWDFDDNFDGTGSFYWRPTYNDAGEYTIIFTVEDDEAEVETETVITVINTNRAPVWNNIPQAVSADETEQIEFIVQASDPDGGNVTLSAVSDDLPDGWGFTDNNDGTGAFNWTPGYEDSGEYSVTFTTTDGDINVQRVVSITVNHVNRTPVWDDVPNSAEIDENGELEFTVTASDPDGDDLSIEAVSADLPQGWTFTDYENGTGDFSWTPSYDDSGEYTIIFTVSDGEFEVESEVPINVNHINRTPQFTQIPDNIQVEEDDVIEFTVAGSDPDGDELSIEAVSDDLPEGWEFTYNGNGSGVFNWTTGFEDEGSYTVSFTLTDNEFEVTEEVIISVGDVNRPPVWDNIPQTLTGTEDSQLNFTVEASDPDADNVTITAASEDLPQGWNFTDHNDGSGSFDWTPGFSDAGEYTLTLTLSDGEFDITRNIPITINNVNREPVWSEVPESVETNENEQLEFEVVGSDPDGDNIAITANSDDLPEGWEFTDNGNGTGVFVWTPGFNDAGHYTLEFTLADNEDEVLTELTITVNNINRAPVWVNVPENFSNSETEEIEFSVVASDPDGNALTLSAASDNIPEGWEFSDNRNGSGIFNWTLGYDDSGDYSVTFTASDTVFNVDTEVTFTVINVNRSPEWIDIPSSYEVAEEELVEFTVEGSDPDNDDITIELSDRGGLPESASFEYNNDGTGVFNWQTNNEDEGAYTVEFTLSDGEFEEPEDVIITVGNVNRPPTWTNVPASVSVNENSELSINVAGSDPDEDNVTITATSVNLPDGWELEDHQNGTATFTWTPGYFNAGNYTVTFIISDNEFHVSRRVTIRVNNVNRIPEWDYAPESVSVDENSELEFTVEASDPDNNQVTISSRSDNLPDGWEFTDNHNGTGTFNWAPTYDDEGGYTLIINASDGNLNVDTDITITVNHVNQAPLWVDIPDSVNAEEADFVEFTIEGSDPDDDDVTIELSDPGNLPEQAAFEYNNDGTGTFSWQTTNDDGGSYTIVFTLSDGEYEVTENVIIAIGDVNRPPVWENAPDRVEADENSQLEFTLEGSDPDGDNVTIEVTSENLPDGWEFRDNEDGTGVFNWTPGFEDEGTYRILFTLSDEVFYEEYYIEHEVVITVNGVNRAPVWDDYLEQVEVTETDRLEFTVEGSDPDRDDLTISATSEDLPEGWQFEDNEDGTAAFNWMPGFDDAGEYTLTITLSDDEYDISRDVVITVNNLNRAPVWDEVSESVEVNENQQLEFTVSGSDPDGDDLTISSSSDDLPEGWDFTDNGDGTASFVWTPNYVDSGVYHLILTISDNQDETDAEVVVIVNDINRSPVWDNVPENPDVDENSELEFTVEASDPDGNRLTLEASSDDMPEGWEFEDNQNGTGTLNWTPTFDDEGEYTLVLNVSDGDLDVDAEITITVNHVNQAPVWGDNSHNVRAEEGAFVEFTVEGSDPDNDEITIELSDRGGLPEQAAFEYNNDGTGNFSWQTNNDDEGSYTIVFTLSDGEYEVTENVIIAIGDVNRPPVWDYAPDRVEVDENSQLEFTLEGSDPDGDNVDIEVTSENLPDGWEFRDNEDGTATFIWTPGFEDSGEYSLTFIISDAEFGCDEDVIIVINNVNRTPVWSDAPRAVEVDEDQWLEFTVTASDPDGNELTLSASSDDLPDGWEFADNNDGSGEFAWKPGFDDSGEYSVLFTVSDADSSVETTTVITVNHVNRPPVWDDDVPDSVEIDEDSELSFTLTGSDPDGDDLTIEFTSENLPEGYEFVDHQDGSATFTWTPTFDDAGEYYATFIITDGEFEVETDVTITVIHVNRPPEWDLMPDDAQVNENELIEFSVAASDPDGDNLTIVAVSDELPEGWEFTDNEDGTGFFSWRSTYEDAGEYHVIFTVSDAEFNVQDEWYIAVFNVNRRPVWDEPDVDEPIRANEGDEIVINISAHDPDADDISISMTDLGGLPDDVEFEDNQDGTAVLTWQTDFEDEGRYTPTFIVSDGELETEVELTIGVGQVNLEPIWDAPDPDEVISCIESEELAFEVIAHDPDNDEMTITITDRGGLPDEAQFTDNDNGTGNFVWETNYNNAGEYHPVFTVSDGDLSIDVTLNLEVVNRNREPYWIEIPEEVVGSENSVIEFTIEGADPDEDALTIEVLSSDLPEGWSFNDNHNGSVEFYWETNFDHEGEYTLSVVLSDGELAVEADISIVVEGENRPPEVVNPIDDIEIDEDSERTLIADLDEVFDDPDGDMLTYEIITNIENLNLNLDAQSHELYFTPEENYFGENEVVIAADDGNDQHAAMVVRFGAQADNLRGNVVVNRTMRRAGGLDYVNLPRRDDSVTDDFVINVLPVNDAPVIVDGWEQAMPDEIDEEITESEELRIELQAYDIEDNNRELGWSVVDDGDLPNGWELTDNQDGTCTFVWTPDRGDAENAPYNPVFRVTDTEDGVDELTINISVEAGEFNDPPVIVEPTEEETYRVTIDEGSRYSLNFVADDPDEDNLSWSMVDEGGLPNGWEFIDNEDGTAAFIWTPGFEAEGEYSPRILVEDGNDHSDAIELVITVNNINREPVITQPEGDPYRVDCQEDEELRIRFNAEDADEDVLTWTIADEDGLPEGWEFTDNEDGTAEFVWTPDFEDEGEYNPVFRVSDGEDIDEIEVLIAVGNCNRRPEWVDIPEEAELTEGVEVVAVVQATDPDNDELTLSASSDDLPDGWEYNDNGDNTMTITWTPSFDDAGEYTLTLIASDAEFDVTVDVRIIVRDENRPPEWTDILEAAGVDENELLEFSVAGSDPDDDELTINAHSEDLPEGWEFTDNENGTGDFTWVPSFDDSGEYTLIFTLSDGEFDVEEEVAITVNHVNRSPIWEDIPEVVSVNENEQIEFSIEGSDPDNEDLTITAASDNLPEDWEFTDNEDGTGDFTWIPSFDDSGEYSVIFILSDGVMDVEAEVVITVNHVNRSPMWTDVPDTVRIDENEHLAFNVLGSDPDADELTLEASSENLPEGWQFTDNTNGTGAFTWTPTYDDAGEYMVTFTISDGEFEVETVVEIVVNDVHSLPDEDETLPTEFTMQPVYPNPFNPIAKVKFGLPEASDVRLMVWDGSGRLIETVMSGHLPAGWHTAQWSADNLPTGVYIFTLRAGDANLVTKGVLIR